MDVRPWQAAGSAPPPRLVPAPPQSLPPQSPPPLLPPPPPPPASSWPAPPGAPYGYVIARQPVPQGWAPPRQVGYWQVPVAPARKTHWYAWAAAALATLVLAVPALLARPHAANGTVGLHAVAGVSAQPWSAEFVDTAGAPARWDPCSPIDYVVNYLYAPPGAQADVTGAIARVSAATGITFVAQGASDESAMRERPAYQPDVYPGRWAPVLIAWSPPSGTDLLDDPKSEAVTVPVAVTGGVGGGSLVSAEVVLNTQRQLTVGFGPGPSEGEVLMHELGHVVGLGHVASTSEAMYPSVRGIAAYGSGDLAGFAAVGRPAGCHPAPWPHLLTELPAGQG